MTIGELLAVIVGHLDDAAIPHMVAGSFASTLHGEPRMTRDIDLVIDPTADSLSAFTGDLDPDRFYVGDAVGALERRDQFNVIELTTGWKVDLMIRKDRPFSRSEFDRRVPAVLVGVRTSVATAEDTILAKLEWAVGGGSDRQMRDVVGMLAVQRGRLDVTYLRQWAVELGVGEVLQQACVVAQGEAGE